MWWWGFWLLMLCIHVTWLFSCNFIGRWQLMMCIFLSFPLLISWTVWLRNSSSIRVLPLVFIKGYALNFSSTSWMYFVCVFLFWDLITEDSCWSFPIFFKDINALRDDLMELKPTFFAGVPRVYERVHEGMDSQWSSFVNSFWFQLLNISITFFRYIEVTTRT